MLPRDEYAQLQYTGTESHIYSASAQWEEQEADRENKFNSKYLRTSHIMIEIVVIMKVIMKVKTSLR